MRPDLPRLHSSLAARWRGETGAILLVVGIDAASDASSVAASLAVMGAADAARPVWLLDLSLLRNLAFESFSRGDLGEALRGVGPPFAAGLRTTPFYALYPEEPAPPSTRSLLTVHRVAETRLMVTRFDAGRLSPGQTVRVTNRGDYWRAVREATQLTVIDSPPLDQSAAALAVTAHADATLLVVRADGVEPDDLVCARKDIEAKGGKLEGIVMTHVKPDALQADRFRR